MSEGEDTERKRGGGGRAAFSLAATRFSFALPAHLSGQLNVLVLSVLSFFATRFCESNEKRF